jgi:hypothetical protein
MSEEEFHVHGLHEHAVEEQAHHHKTGLGQSIALFTAILSTIGATVSYEGGNTQTEALLYKNEAILKKTAAADQWAFYQSESNKAHLMEMMLDIGPAARKPAYAEELEKYQKQKEEIKAAAEQLEKQAQEANATSEHYAKPHHKLSQALTFIQIAIALASITALTRKRWLLYVGMLAAIIGMANMVFGYLELQ